MPPTVAERREYGVVGDPIAHSLSPAIHQAAYRVLDLPWEYHRFRVPQGELSRFLAQHPGLSGLSVTMPLKAEAFSLSTEALPRARETGLANTLVRDDTDRAIRADNTDILGMLDALTPRVKRPDQVLVVGSGATALSAVHALARWGVGTVTVLARRQEATRALAQRAAACGLSTQIAPWGDAVTAEAVINTLPGPVSSATDIRPDGEAPWMLAVGYGANVHRHDTWNAAGGRLIDGRWMLLYQAVYQIRLFLEGAPDRPLPDEGRVIAAMTAVLFEGEHPDVGRS